MNNEIKVFGTRLAKLREIRDRDHAKIRKLERELHQAIVGGLGMPQIIECSKVLISATLVHFESEEQAMSEEELANFLAHQELHAEMVETLEDISKGLEKRSILGAMQLMKFFEGRLNHHLTVEDAEFESHITGQ